MVNSIQQWWAKPFDSQQNAWNWALTIGLIMVLVILWSRVIGMFEAVGESIA